MKRAPGGTASTLHSLTCRVVAAPPLGGGGTGAGSKNTTLCAPLYLLCYLPPPLFVFFKSSPPKRFFSKPPGRRRRKTRHPTLLSRESCFSQRRCCFLSFSYFSSGSLLSFYLSSCIFEPRWRPVCTWPRPHGGRETSESRHHPPTQSKSNRADVQQLPSFVLTHSLRVVRGLCACTRAKTQKEKRAAAAAS